MGFVPSLCILNVFYPFSRTPQVNRKMARREELVYYLLDQGITPKSVSFKSTCQAWLKSAYPEATDAQLYQMVKSFCCQMGQHWKDCGRHKKHFLQKKQSWLSLELKVPAVLNGQLDGQMAHAANHVTKCSFEESNVKQQDLMDFLFEQGLTPMSNDVRPACEAWLRSAFPNATEWQIQKMARNFYLRNRTVWKNSPVSRNRNLFLAKSADRLLKTFVIPIDPDKCKSVESESHYEVFQ